MSPVIISAIRSTIIDLMIAWVGEDPKDAVLIQSHLVLLATWSDLPFLSRGQDKKRL